MLTLIGKFLGGLQKAFGRKFELGLLGLVLSLVGHPGPVVWAGISLAGLFILVEGIRDILVAYYRYKTVYIQEYVKVKAEHCPHRRGKVNEGGASQGP